MSKRDSIFTENLIIFSSNVGKTENVPEFEFRKFIRPSFGDDIRYFAHAFNFSS